MNDNTTALQRDGQDDSRGWASRRALLSVTAAAGVVVALVGGAVAANAGSTSAAPVQATAESPAGAPPAARFLPAGKVIEPGVPFDGGTLALWFSKAADQGGNLTVSLGSKDAKGTLTTNGTANEVPAGTTTTDALKPGFHEAYQAGANLNKPISYVYVGYVVGDVKRVDATIDGKSVKAGVATWSENPKVHAWWVLGSDLKQWPAKGAAGGQLTSLTAYDAAGKVLFGGAKDAEVTAG